MHRHKLLLSAGCAMILSACGGGGGNPGSTGTSAPTQSSQLTAIGAANSTSAASNGYANGVLVSQTSTSVSGFVTGVSVEPVPTGVVTPVIDLMRRIYVPRETDVLAGVTTSQPCGGGGTVTVDGSLHSQTAISNGDTLAITANNCVENGQLINGGLTIAISGVSGDVPNGKAGSVTLATRFNNFRVGGGALTGTLTGDMKIALTATNAANITLAISGSSLQLNEQRAGATVATVTLTDYTVAGNINGTTSTSAASFSVAGNSSALGQFNYTVKNQQPLVYQGGASPVSGAFIVNGAGSSVTLTVLNGSSVKLDYSAKGDGTITQSKTLSWSEFLAAN